MRQRLTRGESITAVQYVIAQETKTEIRGSFLQTFKKVGLIAVPTTLVLAPKIGEQETRIGSDYIDTYTILTKLTLPFNVAGIPALAIPIGLSRSSLSVSAQLVAGPFQKRLILKCAHAYESKFGAFKPPPSLVSDII